MSRLQKLQPSLSALDLDGLLITTAENRRYLSNFTGSTGVLLIDPNEKSYLVTDFRYWEQVGQEVTDFSLSKSGPHLWQSVVELIKQLKWEKVGFEAASLSFQEYQTLNAMLPSAVKLVPTQDLVEKQRWVKDETEIETLAKAAQITDLAWEKALALVKPGIAERELALEFDYQLRAHGADGSAFTTIVASGWRSALPHGTASDRKLNLGEYLLLDGGAVYKGYHADMSRTVTLGKASAEQQRIYQLVLEAQELALADLKAGQIGSAVDAVARAFIEKHGFGSNFGHGLGHSVGLNIHESPRLSITESNPIPNGAAITVEPGIYLPGWGGVRIEDLVIVTTDGVRNLTGSPKQDLIEL